MTEETRMAVEILERVLKHALDEHYITTLDDGFSFMGQRWGGFELIEAIGSIPEIAAKLAEPIT
jgi:hypothetical protein